MRQLEPDELQQSSWLAIEAEYGEKLAKLRKQLEGGLDLEQTNEIRAKIKWCKALLALNPKYTPD